MASWTSRNGADFEKRVGLNLAAARKAAGLTQSTLANHLGVAAQHIHKIETGMNRMSAGRLYMAGELLGVDLAFFFEGSVEQCRRGQPALTPVWDEEAIRVVRLFKKIKDPGLRKCLTDMMVTLAQ